jgi:hypothetical protein
MPYVDLDRKKRWTNKNKQKVSAYNKAYRKRLFESTGTKSTAAQLLAAKNWKLKNRDKVKSQRLKEKESWAYRIARWESSAKRRGLEWTISAEFIKSLPLVCRYTGQPLVLKPNCQNTASLDRLDSSKGYSEDNVVLCSAWTNIMKGTLTVSQFIDMCRSVASHNCV